MTASLLHRLGLGVGLVLGAMFACTDGVDPLPPSPTDAGAQCSCQLLPPRSCAVPGGPQDPQCLREAGEDLVSRYELSVECYANCGDIERAALFRCLGQVEAGLYACFVEREEGIIACMDGNAELYDTCLLWAAQELTCDDTEELAMCRDGH